MKEGCNQGRWKVGVEDPLHFFQPPHRNFEPSFSPPFQEFIITVQPKAEVGKIRPARRFYAARRQLQKNE